MTLDTETPSVDFLILADHAEAINGKVYLMGGGWDIRQIRDFSQPVSIYVAMAVLVPWSATNQRHHFRLRIEDADGHQLVEIKGEFMAGRPPQLAAGTSQRHPLVFNIGVPLSKPGVYAVVAEINGCYDKRTTFTAVLASQTSNPQAA